MKPLQHHPRSTASHLFHKNLERAEALFAEGQYPSSLTILDNLMERFLQEGTMFQLHAAMRELVGDFTGSFSDLERVQTSVQTTRARARLLTKIGFTDQAAMILRELAGRRRLSPQDAVTCCFGIAGRRFDLEVLEMSKSGLREDLPSLDRWVVNCAADHLLALGEFRTCRSLLERLCSEELHTLMLYCEELERRDKLRNLEHRSSTPQVGNIISGVQGWLSIDEANVLASLAASVPDREEIVEIGSFNGRSTVALAFGSKIGLGSQVHAIDPHHGIPGIYPGSTLQSLRYNLCARALDDRVTVHQTTSIRAAMNWAGNSVGLIFIDALHDYESVKEDFEKWLPHLSKGSWILFHDAHMSGPNRLVKEIIEQRNDILPIGIRDSLFVLQRANGKEKAELTSEEKNAWLRYLTFLGSNYQHWVTGEQEKLQSFISGLFKTQSLSSQKL